mgnify:CR=1 FL=1
MKVSAAVFRSLPPHSFLLDLHRSRSIEQAVSWARPPLWATYCLAHSSDSCLLLSTNSPLLTLLKMPESQHQRPTVLCLHPGALSTAKPQRTTARNLAHQMMSGSPCRSTMALVQAAKHRPLCLIELGQRVLSDALGPGSAATNNGPLEHCVLARLFDSLQGLGVPLGGCERIQGTPLPFVYVAHLRTFLLLILSFTCIAACTRH